MKDKWRNYALKDGKISKSYQSKYKNGDQCRKTIKTSYCDSLKQSWKGEEEIVELSIILQPIEEEFTKASLDSHKEIEVPVSKKMRAKKLKSKD